MEKEEKIYHKINLNCEKPIYRNFYKTIENTGLLTLRFSHVFINLE